MIVSFDITSVLVWTGVATWVLGGGCAFVWAINLAVTYIVRQTDAWPDLAAFYANRLQNRQQQGKDSR